MFYHVIKHDSIYSIISSNSTDFFNSYDLDYSTHLPQIPNNYDLITHPEYDPVYEVISHGFDVEFTSYVPSSIR